ncbi:hypothetical protein I317_06049 [Kwoniella heveanensis CBS 569]|nr:hypothetical protein I317_06049 [Kwoniella heveanensis CBS 569]
MRPFPPPPPSFLSASSSSTTSSATTSPTIRPGTANAHANANMNLSRNWDALTASLISAGVNANADSRSRNNTVNEQEQPAEAPTPPSKPQSRPQTSCQPPSQREKEVTAHAHRRPPSPQKTRPKRRPTSAFDDLFADILDALASSGLDTDHGTKTRARTASARYRSTGRLRTGTGVRGNDDMGIEDEETGLVDVQVHGELKKLKHSISERNLSTSARYKSDIQLLDRLILAHRAEQLETSNLKADLAAERELTRSLQLRLLEQKAKHAEEVEGMGKANRRALKVLMELQKEEYLSWAREVLEPNMEIIELGVRRRIANWERGKRERMVLKRQSSRTRNIQQHQRQPQTRHDHHHQQQQQQQEVHPFARTRDRDNSVSAPAYSYNDSSPEEKKISSSRLVHGTSSGGAGGLARRRSSVRGSWGTRKGSVRIKVEGASGDGSLRNRERAGERARQQQMEMQRHDHKEWEDGDGHPFVHALCK